MPFPNTLTGVPTALPPVEQMLGAVSCGPNTLKLSVPPAPLVAPESVVLIALAGIAAPVAVAAGADTVLVVVVLPTAVDAMPLPHVLLDAALLASPP